MAAERNFHHPYTPYIIQHEFMNAVYHCIEERKVGIFESPTGTGKSLSLICGSLSWLREHKRQQFEQKLSEEALDDDEPQWMVEHAKAEKRRSALQRRSELNARLAKIKVKGDRARKRFEDGEPPTKRNKTSHETGADVQQAEEFVLDDYESDEELRGPATASHNANGLSYETQALIEKLASSLQAGGNTEAEGELDEIKIILSSRTHSQLSQFVGELRRVKMPPSLPPDPGDPSESDGGPAEQLSEDFRHLVLGSRKNLCINRKVKSLGSVTTINERCLELQQPSTPKDAKCKFLPNHEREALVNDFRDHTLAKVRDIEDLGRLGDRMGICPYYASRAVIKPSEIISLPYPLLLQKSAREALDLSLKDHVVIIDEAHNLMDTISELHSVSVSLSQLKLSRSQMTAYLQKFRNRLKGKNRVYITQVVRLIDSLIGFLEGKKQQQSRQSEGLIKIGDLLSGKGVDQINMYKLMRYMQESKLNRKVDGYIDFAEGQEDKATTQDTRGKRMSVPVLMQVQSFMQALTNPSEEGKFFYSHLVASASDERDLILRYQLLDPSHHFREIVDEARAVILAGGTMSPMDDYTRHLLSYLPAERIETLSCGHVIPSTNLTAIPVIAGPGGCPFEFSFERRTDRKLIIDLGEAILNAAKIIPDGLVVFFPSYAYLSQTVKVWQSKSEGDPLWARLTATKPIFMEKTEFEPETRKMDCAPTTDAKHRQVDQMLAAYSAQIQTKADSKGALLFAVIGGSLSEGINFADRLGRGVMVVGLPFPNAQSPEWKAKLEFVEKRPNSAAERASAARDFYTNACMRAVNQSIGRAIRHKEDYAAIMLLDSRYQKESIRSRLPSWIKDSLVSETQTFATSMEGLRHFFEGKS